VADKLIAVTYVGPFASVIVPSLGGLPVERGATIRVTPDVAGTAPTGDDPGSGLLAQNTNWQPATTPA